MLSLLNKKPTVQTNPYPHVVIDEALPWDLYEQLENEFPEQTLLACLLYTSPSPRDS